MTLFQAVAASMTDTSPKEPHILLQKSQYINHQWFYAANFISGLYLMLFWTNKVRIKNNQLFRELTPVLIQEVRPPINQGSGIKHGKGFHINSTLL